MKNETVISIISDVSNFNLGIFGISITVFTVLYAFILSRKDSLRDLNDIIKAGNDSPFLVQRVSFFSAHTKKWKELNNHLRNIILLSILFFFIGMVIKYIPMNCTTKFIAISIICLTIILSIYISTVLFLVFKNYNRTTKIN
ncbi:MAG: hypothetical protein MUF43_14645 [Flavobacterium sp.]|jgi:hypothetical protein|nr:hypothetical protein [Flavobacterium sp.]